MDFDHWIYYPILLLGFFAYALCFDYFLTMRLRPSLVSSGSIKLQRKKLNLQLVDICLTTLPLLGLLGTIGGLLKTFMVMANGYADTTTLLSNGIGTALGSTQLALLLAIVGYLLKRVTLKSESTDLKESACAHG